MIDKFFIVIKQMTLNINIYFQIQILQHDAFFEVIRVRVQHNVINPPFRQTTRPRIAVPLFHSCLQQGISPYPLLHPRLSPFSSICKLTVAQNANTIAQNIRALDKSCEDIPSILLATLLYYPPIIHYGFFTT